MNFRDNRYRLAIVLILCIILNSNAKLFAQVVLSADGATDTYKLINSVLAPGYNVVETPDCAHEEFGDHIDQVFNEELDCYVFRFHIHVDEDNDRCKNFDRQRTEIKTYSSSPNSLKATSGETVEYKWKFKLDAGFQTSSSFTHLHQIKAVGGSEEGMPLITLTARSNNKLQLRYAKFASQETIHETELLPLLGNWVEVSEQITYGETGSYKIEIIRMSDNMSVFNYSNSELRMWKTNASFLRPKWGIYRSLDNWEDLRDEMLYFNDFSIEELDQTSTDSGSRSSNHFSIHPNPASSIINIGKEVSRIEIFNMQGQRVLVQKHTNLLSIENINTGVYLLKTTNEKGEMNLGQFVKK